MAGELERIKELQEELSNTPYNKRTQHHVGLIKAKIAKIKEKAEKKEKGKGVSTGFAVRKTGDATVVIVGYPSVGKSTLLNRLTSAQSRIGAYDFTTLDVIPGLLEYEGARIQLLDIPGIIKGASEGKGRGKKVLSMSRAADLILILLEAYNPGQLKIIQDELYQAGLRLNQKKPDTKLIKTSKGGLIIDLPKKFSLSEETVSGILKEFGILNAEVVIREDIDEDQLIDAIQGNRAYIPSITVLNKIDLIDSSKLGKIKIKYDVGISAETGFGIEKLKELIFTNLSLVRIYCKHIGKKPDLKEPLIIKKGQTIEDVCAKLHREFINKFRFARVWGSSRFPGQKFGLNYELKDKDVIEIHLR